jgi:hypothetical protein
MRKGQLRSPIQLCDSEKQSLERLGSNLGGCITSLEAMKGSLVVASHAQGENVWQFRHPTIGDAYAASLLLNPEHLGVYIEGSAPEKLLDSVSCGNVNIKKAVILPSSLYSLMLSRLSELTQSKRYKSSGLARDSGKRELYEFLANRCSKEFLDFYLRFNPNLLCEVADPGLMLEAVPEVRLAMRLNEAGLLPEEKRKQFVETVTNYAVEGHDAAALNNKGIRLMLTHSESEELNRRMLSELLPRLDNVRREWQSNYYSDYDPEEHIQTFLDLLESLKRLLGEASLTTKLIEQQERYARQWIDENTSEEEEMSLRELGHIETQDKPVSTRNIFDDIDADEDVDCK